MNSFWEFRQALPVALDFFTRSGWALLVAIPLIIAIMIRTFRAARRRRKDLLNLRGTVVQLQAELAEIKAILPAPAITAGVTELGNQTGSPRTRRSRRGE
ncbi:hypothetical protein [Glutamicibacter sp. ZJUTW]|uniref:hypothetical protein n=1 Tax=Glutamicibacter sp. ZJUTW TaxID=1155384 RepID=UPI0011F3F2F1|nr:hypothetical protein [Glutamicibacter sp. ZJUTW]QEP06686.1 hypothetical protein F0M17_05235 [Glutamicibacter sp. ZJUTW]